MCSAPCVDSNILDLKADWIDREKAKRQAQDQYQDPLANDYNQ